MTFEKEFKEAISNLPDKEKDKLILRLLRHDPALVNRLHFELLSGQSKEERRTEMESIIVKRAAQMSEDFYSIGYLMMDVRYLSGEITEHVKTTRDAFGEISLNLLMLNEVLSLNLERLALLTPGQSRKFSIYVIARSYKLLVRIRSLHEDYLVDFKPDLALLGENIGQSDHLMRTAIQHGLDVNWLLFGEIPDDIKERHQDLKLRGFLK
ncbi:MAG: hypothetical protein A3D92_08470 [Bacteroidetes bacterium RIFCSPHIGHO2_02_FULL_44_7]|nr:MAG: hypothetical protein A3D92_08470 [Bacteroidetes bacterium RIFCSPHIGHO2_02_FULL_44_7]